MLDLCSHFGSILLVILKALQSFKNNNACKLCLGPKKNKREGPSCYLWSVLQTKNGCSCLRVLICFIWTPFRFNYHPIVPKYSISSLRNCKCVMDLFVSFFFIVGFWFIPPLRWTCELLLDQSFNIFNKWLEKRHLEGPPIYLHQIIFAIYSTPFFVDVWSKNSIAIQRNSCTKAFSHFWKFEIVLLNRSSSPWFWLWATFTPSQ